MCYQSVKIGKERGCYKRLGLEKSAELKLYTICDGFIQV